MTQIYLFWYNYWSTHTAHTRSYTAHTELIHTHTQLVSLLIFSCSPYKWEGKQTKKWSVILHLTLREFLLRECPRHRMSISIVFSFSITFSLISMKDISLYYGSGGYARQSCRECSECDTFQISCEGLQVFVYNYSTTTRCLMSRFFECILSYTYFFLISVNNFLHGLRSPQMMALPLLRLSET